MSSRIGIFGQISEITDYLYLSGAGVLKPEKLKQKRITFIVNATTEEPNAYLQGIDYLKIRVDDNPYARLSEHFDIVADKVKAVKDTRGKVLIHCVAGVSRSASLVIVYLMKHEKMTLRQAYHYVKAARPIIRPNVGFWKQMVDYERKLFGSNSVQMIMTPQCELAIPDVYCTDLKKHLAAQLEAQANSLLSKRRPIAVTSSTLRPSSTAHRSVLSTVASHHRPSSSSSLTSYRTSTFSPGTSSTLRSSTHSSLFSPVLSRRPRESSLMSSLYASPRTSFFSAF